VFDSEDLKAHIEESQTLGIRSFVVGELNLNSAEVLSNIGNYRYRPSSATTMYTTTYDATDASSLYTGATDSDVAIDGGFDSTGDPYIVTSTKQKEKLLFSLEDCFQRFRPRSGINKLRYFQFSSKEDTELPQQYNYTHFTNQFLASRPRYYMADRNDKFKYWSSLRTEVVDGLTVYRGISGEELHESDSGYYIDDVSPFVVYNKTLPANRLVIKMQTNIADNAYNLGPFINNGVSLPDPFIGNANKTTPVHWKVQVLIGTTWTDIITFDEEDDPIGADGYLELAYGKTGASTYGWYVFDEESISDLDTIPYVTTLVSPTQVSGSQYEQFQYISGVRLVVDTMNKKNSMLELIEISPRLAIDFSDRTESFSINKIASDLGVSGMPVGQLLASTGDISIFDYDQSLSNLNTDSILYNLVKKNIQFKFMEVLNDGTTDYYVPLKTLYVESFPESLNAERSAEIQLRDLFFHIESISAPELLVKNASLGYAVSLLLDSIGFSNYVFERVQKRDEDGVALVDSNNRPIYEDDPIIPYFFVGPDKSVAEVLNDLAVSTQSAMFFDENNNLVVMSKDYMLPSSTDRATDITLYGSPKTGVDALENIMNVANKDNEVYNDGSIDYSSRYIQRSYGNIRQASLIDREKTWIYKPALLWEVAGSENTKSINEELNNQSNYSLAAIPLATSLSANIPSVNDDRELVDNVIDLGEGVYWMSRYNGYFYANKEVIKYDAVEYTVDGIGDVWISSVQEYQNFFSKVPFNGKIYPTGRIRIYSEPYYEKVSGNVVLKKGAVAKHGRGQFGTSIVEHNASANSDWIGSGAIVGGIDMQSKYMLNRTLEVPTTISPADQYLAGYDYDNIASTTTRNSVIKNFLSDTLYSETDVNQMYTPQSGTMQSSALVMHGPVFETTPKPIDFISYVAKEMDNKYTHFGTRMRIVGKQDNSDSRIQTPVGTTTYYNISPSTPDQNTSVGGASGGLGVLVNEVTNCGYYFEIAALTDNNVTNLAGNTDVANVFFYKIGFNVDSDYEADFSDLTSVDQETVNVLYNELTRTFYPSTNGRFEIDGTEETIPKNARILINDGDHPGYYKLTNVGKADPSGIPWTLTLDEQAIPVVLWSGFAPILVDDGLFTGQHRLTGEDSPTVFDLAVEYQDIREGREFVLYLNNQIVARVVDQEPEPIYNNVALFTRGSSKCMFEKIYALAPNYADNLADTATENVISYNENGSQEGFRRYAMSQAVQSAYLAGISSFDPPKYDMYFDEFGTIMREAAYFNVKYDKAYPALFSKLSPTFNKMQGYVVSGYMPSAYRAEFLVFNVTDTALNLDETSGNYLRIQGITFTQQSDHKLTVDEYFSKKSDFSDPEISNGIVTTDPDLARKNYQDIKNSRLTYGRKEFTLNSPYIQSQDAANELMGWMIEKIMKPRKSAGLEIFANPMLQLGDIVNIHYKVNGKDEVAPETSRFVVYQIEYSRSVDGPSMTIYLSEVI
jgi:hypothetical protein